MKKKKIKKLERCFYMNRQTGHPSLPYFQKYHTVKSVGFTHNEKDFAPKKQMKRNINPQDNGPCFVKTTIEKYQVKDYRKTDKYKDYRVHPNDMHLIKQIIKKDGKKPSLRKKRMF